MNHPLIGILGGMGPLASSGFVNFLYQKCQEKFPTEQHFPRLILISDPSIPDRMQSVQQALAGKITAILENKIQELMFLGAHKILICCFTAHYFYPWLSHQSQKKIIHLGQLLSAHLDEKKERTLILSSKLLTSSKIIKSHFAIYPETEHLEEIHQLIYSIKSNGSRFCQKIFIELINRLRDYYEIDHTLLACTEFHLMYQQLLSVQTQPTRSFSSKKISSLYNRHIDDGLNIAADFLINRL